LYVVEEYYFAGEEKVVSVTVVSLLDSANTLLEEEKDAILDVLPTTNSKNIVLDLEKLLEDVEEDYFAEEEKQEEEEEFIIQENAPEEDAEL